MGRLTATEDQWQATVIETAHLYGWIVAHFRTARTKSGDYITPVAADGKGFPDLVLAKPGRGGGVLFRELKSEIGKVTPEQRVWLEHLSGGGADAKVWRPSDWDEVKQRLSGRDVPFGVTVPPSV